MLASPNGTPDVQIAYLADCPEHIATLAVWHHEQWSYLSPGITVADRVTRLRANAKKGRIPTTFVVLQDSTPVGCASLVRTDMSSRQNLAPWLASVYVIPELRNTGIGSRLVVRAMEEAKALGERTLYLYTPDRQSFYARLGWQAREDCDYRGFHMTVMEHSLQLIPAV